MTGKKQRTWRNKHLGNAQITTGETYVQIYRKLLVLGTLRQCTMVLRKQVQGPLVRKIGEVITDEGKQVECWFEHYLKLYAVENEVRKDAPDAIKQELDAVPTMEERGRAIDSLAIGKAPDEYEIPAEIIKYNKPVFLQHLHSPLTTIWEEGYIPPTSLINMCYGTFMGWPGTTLPILEAEDSPLPLTADEGSWLASINSLTMLVAIFAAGYAVDVVGRKKVLLFGARPLFIWWVMVAFANSYGMLLAARAIGSLGGGPIITALPVFLCEIADTDVRGTLIVIHYFLMQCGYLLVYSIGPYLSVTTVALICASIPIIFVLTFIWMPESPYFFLKQRREAEAVKCLERFKGQLTRDELKFELESMYQATREKQQSKGKLKDMSSGSIALTTYTTYIFEKSGSELDSNISSIILTAVTLGANVVSSLVIERFDRRPLCMASFSACAICLAAEGAYFYVDDIYGYVPTAFDWVPLAGMTGFSISASIGLAPVLSLVMGELFHVSVKGVASAVGTTVIALYGFFLKKMFQVVSDDLAAYYSF
ncbi:facilitated trehalose transporter Tret1-like [Schistocerca americana]|uniref:facilitated trehalose transporter Tret1-like n=1 Tax=Schistocerca americana TaxID=7009 RepID=UPI001F4F6D69|nr:facilitated trehalose transporter Tret1-like [Schistocerca americana]